MIRFFTFGRAVALSTLPILCSLYLPTAAAQDSALPKCTPASLDVRPDFFNGPGDYFTVALNLRNISEEACVPDLPSYGPQFAAGETPMATPFGPCDACEDHLPSGQVHWSPNLLLNSGETAHQTFRWKTIPPSPTAACQHLSALGGPEVLIVAPSLFKQVCSRIEASRYYPGYFTGIRTRSDDAFSDGQDGEALVLSSSKTSYYQGEQFFLHVSLATPGSGPPTDEPCPTLFLRVRRSDGTMRMDETHPAGFKSCISFIFGSDRNADWQSGFAVDSGLGSRWSGIGIHALEILEVISAAKDARVQFARSNQLKLQIQDPALISRKWGPKVAGVAVDVTLDKNTYQRGEDVPLHIAIENFDAPAPVYAVDPVWDPCTAVAINVWNSQGRLLPESERSSSAICTGHGRGPILYPPAKLVPIETSLGQVGWLPSQPGTYTIVVTWTTNTRAEPGQADPQFRSVTRPYATAQTTATFRIFAISSANSH